MKKLIKIFLVFFVTFQAHQKIDSFIVNCDFKIRSYGVLPSVYTCEPINIDYSSNGTVTGINGTHLAGKSDDDVLQVYIIGKFTLPFFPRGFSNFFKNITNCILINGGFSTLYGDEINEYGSKLKHFTAAYSNLTTISSRLFELTPNVVYVALDNSKVSRVGRELFTPLNVTQLTRVYFNNNQCHNGYGFNQTEIQSLIEDLKINCPFDDEELDTTTIPTTVTTTSTSTTSSDKCFDGEIDEFVCDLNENVDEIQSNLSNAIEELNEAKNAIESLENELAATKETVERLESGLIAKDQRLDDQEERLDWLELEVLRITTNPCACK